MKAIRIATLSAALLLAQTLTVSAQCTEEEMAAAGRTARNYMEAWYQGDAKKMKASLHKKLAKRSLQYGWGDKADLRHTKASHMVSYTSSGGGKGLWKDGLRIDVDIMDCYKNIASVLVLTPHYHEYLHLAKMNGNWVIVNALYESQSPPKKGNDSQ